MSVDQILNIRASSDNTFAHRWGVILLNLEIQAVVCCCPVRAHIRNTLTAEIRQVQARPDHQMGELQVGRPRRTGWRKVSAPLTMPFLSYIWLYQHSLGSDRKWIYARIEIKSMFLDSSSPFTFEFPVYTRPGRGVNLAYYTNIRDQPTTAAVLSCGPVHQTC